MSARKRRDGWGMALLLGLGLLLAACATPAPLARIESFGDFVAPAGYAHYLACPLDYCLTEPDGVTPAFKRPPDQMRFMVRRALDALPNARFVSSTNEGLRLVYATRAGSLFAAGETVTIEIVDIDENLSGLVLYAQANRPGGDAADLKHRMEEWYAAIYRAAMP